MDYELMLQRVYDGLGAVAENRKWKLPALEIGMIGSKKTQIVNFAAVCVAMKRSSTLVAQFLTDELGTRCALSETGGVNIRGKFRRSQLETLIKKYIREVVACRVCQDLDTEIIREGRIDFTVCRRCKSRRAN